MLAAWRAATLGAQVLLLEKTERLGTKILISGGGKCNITHDGPIEDVLRSFRPNEARFIRPACYRLPNTEIVRMLTDRGLKVYTRPDGRIFPVDQTARDVVAILEAYLKEAGVEVRLKATVLGIRSIKVGGAPTERVERARLAAFGSEIRGVDVVGSFEPCDHVVVAAGGCSYPKSGTTGDGWVWAKALGHTVEPVHAALAPLEVTANDVYRPDGGAKWPFPPGVALRNVVLKARQGGREVSRWQGDLLFTHHGLSGPCALGISRTVVERMSQSLVTVEVDLCPDDSFEFVSFQTKEWIGSNPLKKIAGMPNGALPASLLPYFFAAAKIEPETTCQRVSRKDVNRLVECLKGWQLGNVRHVPIEKGEVVAGGVSLGEVDPQTMRSRVCPGLYLCGEALDIAGPVGGYNLQAAFATGYVAGETAAKDALGGP